jgi:hypothetical protein
VDAPRQPRKRVDEIRGRATPRSRGLESRLDRVVVSHPDRALVVWLFVNPLFFDVPASTRSWASRSVFGERIWSERDRNDLPPAFRSQVPKVAQVIQTLAAIQLVYGLVVFDAVATVSGVVFMQAAKCWYLDRMVLLFEAVKQNDPEVAAWEY